jgi:hypothetical protein
LRETADCTHQCDEDDDPDWDEPTTTRPTNCSTSNRNTRSTTTRTTEMKTQAEIERACEIIRLRFKETASFRDLPTRLT